MEKTLKIVTRKSKKFTFLIRTYGILHNLFLYIAHGKAFVFSCRQKSHRHL